MPSYLYAFACVVALSAGQVLFKAAAIASKESNSFIASKPMAYLAIAIVIYAGATLLWVWLLRTEDLGRVYPVMAFAFILVPIASHLFFGERFMPSYIYGTTMIVIGLFLIARS